MLTHLLVGGHNDCFAYLLITLCLVTHVRNVCSYSVLYAQCGPIFVKLLSFHAGFSKVLSDVSLWSLLVCFDVASGSFAVAANIAQVSLSLFPCVCVCLSLDLSLLTGTFRVFNPFILQYVFLGSCSVCSFHWSLPSYSKRVVKWWQVYELRCWN